MALSDGDGDNRLDDAQQQEDSLDPVDESGQPSRRGRKRRRDLAERVDEDPDLKGQAELMVSSDTFEHEVVLRGHGLTTRGGPAREVFRLGEQAIKSLEALFPGINPQLSAVTAGSSVVMKFYPADEEVEAARRRLAEEEHAREEPTREERGEEDEGIGAARLPDTSLAILALADALSRPDPVDAGETLRAVSVVAAESVKDFAVTLVDHGVELDLSQVTENARVEPVWTKRLVEYLDATGEVPTETVTVYGVLQGANSGGEGSFEIVTEATRDLPPALGRRTSGDKIGGSLTPRARRQIREGNLWDTNVVARLEVIRERRGRSLRQRGLRLMSVERLPPSG